MPCTVHCLVSEKEQLGPLMQRIARAEIPLAQVSVVWRDDIPRAGNPVALLPWFVFALPAAWWWSHALSASLSAYGGMNTDGAQVPASVTSEVELAARRVDRSAG